MEDVLRVYKRPPDPKRPVVGLDEKPVQLLSDVRPSLPPRAGDPAERDHECGREGHANVFCAFEPLANWRDLRVTERRTRLDFAAFVKDLLDERYAGAEKVVLMMDNLNTHTVGSLYEAFEPAEARRVADKLEIHYMPKHGSWLNMAEVELSVLSRQVPGPADLGQGRVAGPGGIVAGRTEPDALPDGLAVHHGRRAGEAQAALPVGQGVTG